MKLFTPCMIGICSIINETTRFLDLLSGHHIGVAIFGPQCSITKGATLTNEKEVEVYAIRAMKFSVSPAVSVAVECRRHTPIGENLASNLYKLEEALEHFAQSDYMILPRRSGVLVLSGPNMVVDMCEATRARHAEEFGESTGIHWTSIRHGQHLDWGCLTLGPLVGPRCARPVDQHAGSSTEVSGNFQTLLAPARTSHAPT
ncbi:hypothetical protein COLO4_13035 [Corchorus olitorius]|uniref:Uncharacterized protein n=1 Tax=Corchorus olitorius TaxID=93759 RepID=A0A1R3JYK9_9ROSI|nr:hypothetical protein COLO4_13035 [Corchorus olitorius]